MHPLKMYLLLKMVVFHCYVSLPEGSYNLAIRQPRLTHPRADVPFDAVDDAERCVSYLSDQA